MKTTLLAGLAVSLFSTAAFADDCDHGASPVAPGYVNANYYGNRYDRRPPAPRNDRGRYELQSRQRWVPGQVTQVWVAGVCHRVPFSPVQACTPGHYVTQQQPGHYETVQEWVWVDFPRHNPHRFGRGHFGRR
jgi:hypothetical protein